MSSTKASGKGDAASARAQHSIESLLLRHGLIAGVMLVIAVALAWRWLIMSGMSAMPMGAHHMGRLGIDLWSADYLGPAFTMWAIMMVGMMLPSAAPMILLHIRIDRATTSSERLAHTVLFSLAYLLVWTGFSAAATIAQALLIDLDLLSAASLALGDHVFAAALLVAAAVYQLSPAKAACLKQCRSPVHFIMQFWSPGVKGAFRLGLMHGLYCVGCCWGLMLLLFVAGVMNLAWIAMLAALVLVEKLAPPRWHASKVIAALLLSGAMAMFLIR